MNQYSAIIAGTGSCVPEKRLTNEDLSRLVDTSDEWIVQRTGIKERRIAAPGESTLNFSSKAATMALKAAGIEPKHLDLILVGTVTPELTMPSTACLVAAALGLDRTPGYDLSAACSGFLYALHTATAFIECGRYKHILVIGAETLSRMVDYQDRSSCILFGDGGGAVVLSRSQEPRRGVLYSSMHADGNGWEFLYTKYGARHPISAEMIAGRDHFMKIRGREIYKFAVTRFNELIDDALEKTGLKIDDVKLIVPHQVNLRIIDSAMERLNLPREKAFVNIDRYGNTSAASIPIALDEAVRLGKLKKGDVALMVAFGAGLTWANAVVRM
jgi:3-oxoacyl-[acyl-carrier-protein] synthase-3